MGLVGHHKNDSFQGQTNPRTGKPSIMSIFVCYSPPFFLVILNSKIIFPKYLLERQLKPYLWSWLVSTKMTHFQGQTSPEQVNPPSCRFSCAIVHRIFCYPEFFAKNLQECPLRPYLQIQMVTTAKKGSFSRSNDPQSR